MTHLYYKDLRRRIEALEARYFHEPEAILTICAINIDDGLPMWVSCAERGFRWTRQTGQPIPPEVLDYAEPEARAAYEAKEANKSSQAP
jgi:hypothetical protein